MKFLSNSIIMFPLEKSAIISGIKKLKSSIIRGVTRHNNAELQNKIIHDLNRNEPTEGQIKQSIKILYRSNQKIDNKGRTYRERYNIWHKNFAHFLQTKFTKKDIAEFKSIINDLRKFNIINKDSMVSDFKKLDSTIMCIGNHFGQSPDILPPLLLENGKIKGYNILMRQIKREYNTVKLRKNIGDETEQFNPHNIYQVCAEQAMKQEGIPVKFVLRGKGEAYNRLYKKSDEIILKPGKGVEILTENLRQDINNIFIFSEGGFRMLKTISSGAIISSLNAGIKKLALFAAPDPFISPAIPEINIYYIGMIQIPKDVEIEYQKGLKSGAMKKTQINKFLNHLQKIIQHNIDKYSNTKLYKTAIDTN